jgi:pyruvate dehydrogenase E2 component (dihydrolipoamide acetyltransferase)
MSSVRRKTSEQMALSWSSIPHVTQFDQADVTQLEELRKRYAERVEAAGGKLTVTAIVLKVVAGALKRFPKFNASLDLEHQEIVYRKAVHIGVAVDTERGLLVPVIRGADQKSLLEIAVELTGLADRARNRKVTIDELRGGGFSITNLGGLGTTYFSPIVNWPEVAVLGIGRAATQAVWTGGEFAPRLILPLSISFDHRVIDGADAARFLRWIAEALEQPMLLILEG